MKIKNEYFFGLDEVSSELNIGCDKGLKDQYIAHFANAFNCKTVRIWLATKEIIKVKEDDKIEFIADGLIRLHNYLEALRRKGVERFLLLDWAFVYPYGYIPSDRWVVPDPKTEPEMYRRFLLLQQKVRYEIASNFSLIAYFETTNEPDGEGGTFLHKNGYKLSSNKNNEDYIFTRDEIEDIILDLNYYETLGIKQANPHAKMLLPSFCNFDYAPEYLDDLYHKIESGKYPTVGERKSNRIESFFEILNWHPYNLKDVQINDYWLMTQERLHQISINHNDGDRPVWYTENGWSDFKREDEKQQIGQRFIDLFNMINKKLPWVETVFLFRLFTLANKPECEGEDNFGLVYNEYDWFLPLCPKQSAIDIYKYIHGKDASLEPLYKFAKNKDRELFPTTKIGNGDYKVLILGNHITYQKAAPWNEFKEGKGLGASKPEKDYTHQLFELLKKDHHSIEMTLMDIRNWETTFYYSKLYSELAKLKDYQPNLVIIRLGEVIGDCSLKDHPYEKFILKLCQLFDLNKTRIVITSTFTGREEIDLAHKKVAEQLGERYVDLTDLRFEYSYTSKERFLNNEFKIIPNDLGMSKIAERIYQAIIDIK